MPPSRQERHRDLHPVLLGLPFAGLVPHRGRDDRSDRRRRPAARHSGVCPGRRCGRPRDAEAAPTPKWMGAIDGFNAPKSLGAGQLGSGAARCRPVGHVSSRVTRARAERARMTVPSNSIAAPRVRTSVRVSPPRQRSSAASVPRSGTDGDHGRVRHVAERIACDSMPPDTTRASKPCCSSRRVAV